MSDEVDVTPDGDPIDVVTIWLGFNHESVSSALSVDLTRWNAAMRRLTEATRRRDTRD